MVAEKIWLAFGQEEGHSREFVAVAYLKAACRQENIGTGRKREWQIKRLTKTYLVVSVQE